jgi:hypothetical protein
MASKGSADADPKIHLSSSERIRCLKVNESA